MTTSLRERAEIPAEHTWDTDSIYADLPAWEAALDDVRTRLAEADAFRGRLGESPAPWPTGWTTPRCSCATP